LGSRWEISPPLKIRTRSKAYEITLRHNSLLTFFSIHLFASEAYDRPI
jgi:hypothetical protein